MSKEDTTIAFTLDLKEHMCSEGFPRVNFASLVRQRELSRTPITPESTNGVPTLPTDGKLDLSRQMNMIQSRKTYRGIREQDFYEVAQGYDTDDSFVDDSEPHEDLAPYEAKLEHGSFYVNFGEVVFTNKPREESPTISPPKATSENAKLGTDTGDIRPLSPDFRKRPNSIIEHDGYLITPPKKLNKKRKDSIKFSPKMVLKRSKSLKGPSEEVKKELTPTGHPPIPPLPVPNEDTPQIYSNQVTTLLQKPPQTEILPTESLPHKPSSSQPNSKCSQSSSKQAEKAGKQLKQSTTPPVDPNALLLTKFSEANLLIQMELTQDCFTPAFYEKNDIHKFASQIPEALRTILQLFFNHIQVKINNPASLNSQESQFERCLIVGKIHAFLKRKQDQALTLAIHNYLEHFFQNKMHSFELILETILKIIQSAFLYNPLQTLLTHIQPYIDRINENDEDKPFACKKRFKWSFGLKQLLGGAITAQIDLEKNGFGMCQESFTNEQIILQFLNIYILPCWPKGRMKASKLYKVTLPFHEQFTKSESASQELAGLATTTISPTTTTTTSTEAATTASIPTTNTKIGNWKIHMTIANHEPDPKAINSQAKIHELPNDNTTKKNFSPAKITNQSSSSAKFASPSSSSNKIANPTTKIGNPSPSSSKFTSPSSSTKVISPKPISAHPNQLNPELIPVASQMSLTSLSFKKSPLIKQTMDVLKHSPKAILPKPDVAHAKSPHYTNDLDIKPTVLPTSYSLTGKIPTCILTNQNVLSAGNAVYANTYANPISQTNEQIASFNQLTSQNFAQNFAYLQTFPETIIHLKPGSKESPPKNAKSNSSSQ